MKRFLPEPTENEREFLLLGYPLRLSPCEAKLLRRLMVCGVEKKQNLICVRVCSINKKAYRISGRTLILLENGVYRINPYL